MDQSITRKDVSHRYLVRITNGASVTRKFVDSNPEDISDVSSEALEHSPLAKVEYKRLGVGLPTLVAVGKGTRNGRTFHTAKQMGTYLTGYATEVVTDDGLDDLSWLGAADADMARTVANEQAEERAQARAEMRREMREER